MFSNKFWLGFILFLKYIQENPGISEDKKTEEIVHKARELMELTPGDVDLWRKYVIACNSLIRMYEEELKQKQERARALGGRDTQLNSRIQSIAETINILKIFRETFDTAITSYTGDTGILEESPVIANENEGSGKTNSDASKGGKTPSENQQGQHAPTSSKMSRRDFLRALLGSSTKESRDSGGPRKKS